jgi:Tfp pilus assembly protein PilX
MAMVKASETTEDEAMRIYTTGSYGMKNAGRHASRLQSRGFTLIASLLMLMLLSGIAIGLMMMVNTETKVGSTDLQNNLAFHAADGGMEKMASDLSATFQNAQAPTAAQICALGGSTYQPQMVGVTWTQYTVAPASGCSGTMQAKWGQISAGPNQGLWAQIIPINMLTTANLMGNQEVSMTRGAQVALIPVFQFGVFCEGDCGFFSSPNLTFAGRVHTNGDLYLGVAGCCNLIFNNKIEAYGNVVTSVLPNGLASSSYNDTGNVYVPTLAGGCSSISPLTNCSLKTTNGDGTYGDGSVTGAGSSTPQTTATYNATNWNPFSTTSTNHMIINGNFYNDVSPEPGNVPQGTGAKKLSMPFVNGTTFPYEIIRRATSGDGVALSQSREYNLAQIRVLLSDDPSELPGGSGDSNNIRLANVTADAAGNGASNPYGIVTSVGTTTGTATPLPSPPAGTSYTTYFATATNSIPSFTCTGTYNPGGASPNVGINCLPDWPYPPAPWTPGYMTAVVAGTNSSGCILLCPSSQTNAWAIANTTGKIGAPFISGSINTALGGMTGGPSLYTAGYPGTFQVTSPNAQTYSNIPTFLPCPMTNVVAANKPGNCPLSSSGAPTSPFYLVNSPPPTSNATFANPVATATSSGVATATWNLIDGWLRVEYKDSTGVWHPVTSEWLQLGFARDVTAPTAAKPNPINPNAILLLQEPADRYTQLTSPATGAAFAYPTSAIHTTTNAGFTTSAAAPGAACTATSGGACTQWYVLPPQVLVDSNTNSWLFGNASATFPATPASSTLGGATGQSPTRFNWYPINFYDAREGEPRDVIWSSTVATDNTCTTNGIMSAVEIDVGNLKKWLAGTIGTNGNHVDAVQQNGYVLYFSDRRGMLPNKFKNGTSFTKSGDSGLEDVVNAASAAGNPDGVLEAIPTGRNLSPEDVNQDGLLDNFGAQNMGLGFYGTGASPVAEPFTTNCSNANMPCQPTATTNNLAPGTNMWYQVTNNDTDLASPDPYSTSSYNSRIQSCSTARKNWVSGARHVLKLVDGAFGQVPLSPSGTTADPGGFTVASENPVYIQGDYNSNAGDPFWAGLPDASGHAASAVIADAVSILSNNWVDQYSTMGNPANGGNASPTLAQTNRPAVTTYYRVAIAGGKNMAFPFPSWESNTDYGFGTDGGVHNFLRFLEDWQTTGSTLNYGGSLVSLYYATYNTGLFKCCAYSVYQPPVRNYIFDSDFTLPSGLPPGTPMFRDVETLSYRQLFATRQASQ